MIQIQNLDFAYKKGRPVFTRLNLDLLPGHIYGLLGKNGAGKSTLLKSMAGLAFPQAGKCMINGIDASKRPVSLLEDLFFLPEEIYVPALTSAQFLRSTATFYPKFSLTDYYVYLKTLDVDADAVMDRMSYGQQKKAMIAFGLATNTSVLIMDEPTNGLDIPSKVQFRKLIASVLNDERCILISTHQVRDLDSLIDTVLILDNQRIVVKKAVDEISEQLTFGLFEDTTGMPVLYEEETMRGKYAILKNNNRKYSRPDLELLFNAITTGNQQIVEVINGGTGNE
ncbi:ATP-binding cassette domain-containing protein [Mucilaginibacter sp. SG564]|uniref:ABC transporter ATP-binding protein n=1 Tax=Mucilaginibacter sp. SG564 TaxID=2587022 RepID=UPI001557E631|nr:ABC transporter ATP-binding protein [Mucilaginibacter sp. SG564]NOW97927.1 ABC-2 type transport system ATP-binding protein [Mucilaginibacter sp. SG564]